MILPPVHEAQEPFGKFEMQSFLKSSFCRRLASWRLENKEADSGRSVAEGVVQRFEVMQL